MRIDDVELGDELPEEHPDVSLETVRAVREGGARWTSRASPTTRRPQAEGLPGAVIPGIMSQGQLAAMIHRWAPGCAIIALDTIFRTPMVVGTAGRVPRRGDRHRRRRHRSRST